MIQRTYPDDGSLPKNLNAGRPLHYEGLSGGLWGPWIVEMAKDIAAVGVLHYMEEADAGYPPDCESYYAAVAGELYIVRWWSPAAHGQIRMKVRRDEAHV